MATRQKLPPQIKKLTDENGRVYWELRMSFGGRENRSQPKRQFDSETEALAAFAELLSQKARGITAVTSKLTVEKAIDDWIAGKRTRKNTVTAYTYSLKPLRELYGSLLLTELEKEHLDKLANDLLMGACRRANETPFRVWKPVTVNVMLRHVTTLLQSYYNQGKLVRNVGTLVERCRGAKYKRFETYTEDEVVLVIAEADKDRNGHAWHLSLSGLRRGEMGGLRWNEDVDFTETEEYPHGSVSINPGHARISVYGQPEEGDPKTDNGIRTLPLTLVLNRSLKTAHRRQAEEKLRAGSLYEDRGYVVCDEFGCPYHPDTLSDYWLALCRRAGVKRIRLQDARHTCATLMHLQGVAIAIIAAWLGHADPAFTMRTYVNPNKGRILATAREVMQAITSKPVPAAEEEPVADSDGFVDALVAAGFIG